MHLKFNSMAAIHFNKNIFLNSNYVKNEKVKVMEKHAVLRTT